MSDVLRAQNGHLEPRRVTGGLLAFLCLLTVIAVLVVSWARSESSNGQQQPTVREFTLTAEEIDWELQPGTVVKAWTYNRQMPGPELRVREGDLVRVTLVNKLPTGTTIHWHGLDVPNDMDGPVGLNQAAVEPGESFVYEFTATPAGTRWYHSHTDVANQVMLGLYGAIIVEPADGGTEYDRDYTYTLTEWDLELTPDVALGNAPRGPRDQQLRGGELGTDLFLMNGKIHEAIPPIYVEEGDKVLIRLVNAGTMAHPFHTHGHTFKIVATDGNPVPPGAQLLKDTVMIAPGERYDLEFEANNPGVWMVHCHIENHADNGMMTIIQYKDAIPPGPLGEHWDPKSGQGMPGHTPDESGHHGHTVPEETATPAEPVDPTPTPEEPQAEGEEVVISMTDNRFNPKTITVKAGTKITWVNNGANWHSVAGANGLIKSAQIGAGERYSVVLDVPGTYNYICQHHLRQGMTGQIIVTE
jgi:plastocyanin